MATVRVFLPTYRRPHLLPRAIASLRAQTFSDWICDVHNDAPEDDTPRKLLSRLKDTRFCLNQHQRNLGGGATFNLFYRATEEPFFSILEDDNWWEPEFLEEMLYVASQEPDIQVLWSNMRLWREQSDGSFLALGRCIQDSTTGSPIERVAWGTRHQIVGALHSNGAALHRSHPELNYQIPAVPFAAVEMFRERMFPHPLVLVRKPLANFSITLRSERTNNAGEWAEVQTALAATFLKHASYDAARLGEIWAAARAQRPPGTSTLLLAGLVEPACRPLLRHATSLDWLRLARGLIRRPRVLRRVLRSRVSHPDWWQFLEQHTAARFAEARARS